MYLEVLQSTNKRRLVQSAWNFMNDSLRSDVFMRFHPESIACACIYLAARQCMVPLPNNPPWYWLFSVDEPEIQDICLSIMRLYARAKPNYEALEKTVEDLKRKQQAAKSKARGILSHSDVDTPNSSSRQNSPKTVSPHSQPSTLLASMRKEKERVDEHISTNNRRPNYDDDHKTNNVTSGGRKRSRERSVDSAGSGSGGSTGSRSSKRSRSPSSDSPGAGKRRRRTPPKKPRKPDSGTRDKHKKNRYRSVSRSPSPRPSKTSKKSSRYYKESSRGSYYKDGYRSSDKDQYLSSRDQRGRSYSPADRDRHRSRKHRNGHRDSPIREKGDKHRR